MKSTQKPIAIFNPIDRAAMEPRKMGVGYSPATILNHRKKFGDLWGHKILPLKNPLISKKL